MEHRRFHPAWGIFFGTCIMSVFGYGMSNGTGSIFMPVIIEDLGVSYASYSVTSILSTAVLIICMPIVGKMAQKVSPKLLTSAAAVLLAAGFFFKAGATSVWGIYASSILSGIGSSVLTGMYASILLATWFEARLGSVTGFMWAVGGFSAALFNPVAGHMIVQLGWRQASVIMGIIAIATLLPAAIFLLRMPSGREEIYRKAAADEKVPPLESIYGLSRQEIQKLPAYYLIIAATVGFSCVSMLPNFTGAQVLSRGLNLVQSGYISSCLMVATGIAKILLGMLLDRFGPRIVLPAYTLLGAAGMIGMGCAGTVSMMACSAFLTGIGTSIYSVSTPFILKSVIGNRAYDQTYSKLTMLTCIAPLIIAIPIGMLYDKAGSYSAYYMICAVLIIAAGTLLVQSYQSSGKRRLPEQDLK